MIIYVLVYQAASPPSSAHVTGYAIACVESELQLFEQLATLLRAWDPDLLVAYEPQQLSWGYLIDRARTKYNIDLCTDLSRTPNSVCAAR